MRNNSVVLDLRKVQWGVLDWQNQDGLIRKTCPTHKTVNGAEFEPSAPAGKLDAYPGETMLERAIRLDLLDVWKPVVTFQLAANHNVIYHGKKALSMWRVWQSRIFGKRIERSRQSQNKKGTK
jgi:hypothetical protein